MAPPPPLPIAPSELAQYATTNASATELYQEEVVYAGLHLGGIAFGLHLMVYFMCTYYLLRAAKVSWFTQTYITILLALASVNYGTNVKYGAMGWIEFRGFTAGPGIFLGSGFSLPMHLAGDATLILLTFFVDSLVIHRAFLVWENNWRVIVVPVLMLTTAIVFSVIRTIAVAEDIRALAMHSPIADGLLIFWVLSLVLNVVLTALIMGRLLSARTRARKYLGVHHATVYTQIAAMIIESAAVYMLLTLAFVILFGLHYPAYNVMIVLYPQVQVRQILLLVNLARVHVLSVHHFRNDHFARPQAASAAKCSRKLFDRPAGIANTTGIYAIRHACFAVEELLDILCTEGSC
ncbi:hypothetical protein BDZ89DRAFT_393324 [Hymenopellis radicata]|nr:hypothetical protein BDZ89DRAFT_393324 [Hymenopellis radicata]